jgi:Nitroreductase family
MDRRKFLNIAGGSVLAAGAGYYLLSDKSNFTRENMPNPVGPVEPLHPDEHSILNLAGLAPSGHNTQPWLIKYKGPFNWVIGNDKTRWLPAVDPHQRETILSIGAFMQTLKYAAASLGYSCAFTILATNNQAEDIAAVQLTKMSDTPQYDANAILQRRTVRSHYLDDLLQAAHIDYLLGDEKEWIHYLPNNSKEHVWLNEQTIEANRIQAYRDAAQEELSNWMRFSSKEAAAHRDGLTTASMELEGLPAWLLRNFYSKQNVLKKGFRDKGIDKVKEQVGQSAGWIVITSKDDATGALLATGQRMQRLFLKVREKGIALHPMTQILEESQTRVQVNQAIGLAEPIQFLLRTGYLKNYPNPVSLRRPVAEFLRI